MKKLAEEIIWQKRWGCFVNKFLFYFYKKNEMLCRIVLIRAEFFL